MKFSNRYELSCALMPFVLNTPQDQFRPWMIGAKPLEVFQTGELNRCIWLLEQCDIYNQSDLADCIPLLYHHYWNKLLFMFIMSCARLPYSISILLKRAIDANSSLVNMILRYGKRFGLDMEHDENSIDLVSYCIQHPVRHVLLKVQDIMHHISNKKLGDKRWIATLTLAATKLKTPAVNRWARIAFNALLEYADVKGDGIILSNFHRGEEEREEKEEEEKLCETKQCETKQCETKDHFFCQSFACAPDFFEKRSKQAEYMQKQLKVANDTIQHCLVPEIMNMICSFYVSSTFRVSRSKKKVSDGENVYDKSICDINS
jgi:hypothetical protein